jgi:predicted nucleic acid-binding protein
VSAARTIVIDASVVVHAALVKDGFEPLLRSASLVAPSLLWSESAAALSQLRWRDEISERGRDDALERLLAAPIGVYDSRDLMADAIAIAADLGWAKTYDAEYVALARQLHASLMTVDARLSATAARLVPVIEPIEVESD